MEYIKEYQGIDFKVSYSLNRFFPSTLSFSAIPYEWIKEEKGKEEGKTSFLLYGKVEKGEKLSIGFKGFTFNMTETLHGRLGLLYDAILNEYRKVVN